jgi:hypothetical protein
MLISLIRRAAIIGTLALAIVPVAAFSQWTSFSPGTLGSFSFTHNHRPDGRFVFGTAGAVRVQDSFGSNAFTTVSNIGSVVFDPSFIIIDPSDNGLIGGGGFSGPSGLFSFSPATPTADIGTSPLATLQNYAATWWQHPSSGRSGWLIAGGNGIGGSHNLTFVSSTGTFIGAVTTALSSFSGGVAADAAGNVFAALADFNPEVNNLIIKFTADQIDAAVLAILTGAPTPLVRIQAQTVLQAAASGALAVDAAGRLWMGGFQIDHLQAFDPNTSVTRRFYPLTTPVPTHNGPPSYAPRAFKQAGEDRLSFLANDSLYTTGSDLILGHAALDDLPVRAIQFDIARQTANEGDGVIEVIIRMSSSSSQPVTVPVQLAGSATANEDYLTTTNEVVFQAGETSASFLITLIDDTTPNEPDETIELTLGQPTPATEAGLGSPASEFFTLSIEDNEAIPAITRTQPFPPLRVGSPFSYQMLFTRGTPTRWSASGLPPGLRIDPTTGILSGVPTAAGDFDRLVITASNAFGQASSIAFLLDVQPLPAAVVGQFSGLIERAGNATGELGGRILLTTTTSSTFTAALTIGKKRFPLRGQLDSSSGNSTGTGSVAINGVALPFAFTIDELTSEVIGSVGSSQFNASLHRPQPSRTGLCHFLAFQNLLPDDRPQGFNFGTVLIPSKGLVRIAGRTADGSRFTSSSAISQKGEVFLYQALYRQLGTLSGLISVGDDLQMNLVGLLDWSKPSQTSGALYRNGWPGTLSLNVTGGKYRPASGAALPLNALPSSANNAQLGLALGGIDAFGADPLTYGLRIVSLSRVITPSPLSVRINNRTGLVSGRLPLTQGNVRRTATLVGLLIPSGGPLNPFQTDCYGYFVLPTATRGESRSGQIQMTAD